MPQLINMAVTVNRANIRREMVEGREHLVVSSYTLPANVVMNGILYPEAEIDKYYDKLEGTLAPFGHPQRDGKHVSAFDPIAINSNHVGAWNRNVRKAGKRIHLEKWIDIEFAKLTPNGQRLVGRLEQMERGEEVEPIHTSVALFIEQLTPNAAQKKEHPTANAVARIVQMDHDAILMDEPGAATPAQGVGMMVNADLAVAASVVEPTSGSINYRELENELREAARAKFPGEEYVWIENFSDDHVVITHAGVSEEYEYSREAGNIVLGATGTPVKRKESWVANTLAQLKAFFNQQAPSPAINKEGDMPMTAEEIAAVATKTAEILAPQFAANLDKALNPVNQAITALQEGQAKVTETITANARAAEDKMRSEVAAKYGEPVAKELTGNALVELHKTLGTAPTLAPNSGAAGASVHADDAKFIPA